MRTILSATIFNNTSNTGESPVLEFVRGCFNEKLLSSSNSDRISMLHLLENGMNRAAQGCLNLSHIGFAELYITQVYRIELLAAFPKK